MVRVSFKMDDKGGEYTERTDLPVAIQVPIRPASPALDTQSEVPRRFAANGLGIGLTVKRKIQPSSLRVSINRRMEFSPVRRKSSRDYSGATSRVNASSDMSAPTCPNRRWGSRDNRKNRHNQGKIVALRKKRRQHNHPGLERVMVCYHPYTARQTICRAGSG